MMWDLKYNSTEISFLIKNKNDFIIYCFIIALFIAFDCIFSNH